MSSKLARTVSNPKWVRGLLDGKTIVDSRDALFVWEHEYYPAWYFPVDDVAAALRPTDEVEATDNRGEATVYDLVVGDHVVPRSARVHQNSPLEELRNRVRFEWDAFDQWFEEDTEVYVHPRSPYTRVDALASSRHVRVLVDGVVVADSNKPTILYETGLPPRYYLPPTHVRLDLLAPSTTTTSCPYKGHASYWSVTVDDVTHEDIVWGYPTPLPESAAVAGMRCFYNEKVDIEIDGQLEGRPKTQFS